MKQEGETAGEVTDQVLLRRPAVCLSKHPDIIGVLWQKHALSNCLIHLRRLVDFPRKKLGDKNDDSLKEGMNITFWLVY